MSSSVLASAPEPRTTLEMLEHLEHIDRERGGVRAHLVSCTWERYGVSADQLRMLRERLVWRLAGANTSSGDG